MTDLIIPKKIADIITCNRNDLALGIKDMSALSDRIDPQLDGNLRGEISPAYLISMTFFPNTVNEVTDFHILGEHVTLRTAYSTSRIVGMSEDRQQVKTQSGSIYQISGLESSEPPLPLLLHLCHTLHFWRLGKRFGVLEVYY
ncbi:hypothetical protein [Terasakiella pusilla]|uniref:hypothetical protein n=1 Tax=Terasakiella pusilla TaxID=64973 RepID=UPI003AA8CCC8